MADNQSVRESLEAVMAEAVAEPTPAPAPTPEPVQAATPEPVEADARPEGDRERDEHGRFKPKTNEAQAGAEPATPEPAPQPAATADSEPQAGTIRVPHALPAPLKAEFGDLPEKWREAFVKQEDSIKAFKDEQAPKAARLNRYDEIIGPHLDKWRFAGLDEFSGVQTLLAAQNILERNPVEGLVHIARSYGVNPLQIAQALGLPQSAQTTGAEGYQAPPAQPDLSALQPVLQRVQTLEQQLNHSAQATAKAEIDRLTAEVDAFAKDPANVYFHNVEEDMVRLIQAKAATGLRDAYEKAIWASSEIRPLLIKQQSSDQAKKSAEDAARAKANAARQASGSVTGAPSPGASAPKPGSSGSIRADLEAAFQAHSSAA